MAVPGLPPGSDPSSFPVPPDSPLAITTVRAVARRPSVPATVKRHLQHLIRDRWRRHSIAGGSSGGGSSAEVRPAEAAWRKLVWRMLFWRKFVWRFDASERCPAGCWFGCRVAPVVQNSRGLLRRAADGVHEAGWDADGPVESPGHRRHVGPAARADLQ